MHIIKNKSVDRRILHWCLLITIALFVIGCESPDSETQAPSTTEPAAVIEMEIVPPEVDSPESSDENDKSGSNSKPEEDPDDGPGPSLNAPKSTSMSPNSRQGTTSPNDSAIASAVTASVGSEDPAFLATRFLSWNVESEGADADVICKQLSKMNQNDRYDIVGLTEVEPPDWKKFRSALGEHYRYEFSRSGYNDRMQILFNTKVYEEVRHFDLKEVNILNRYRAPLVVHLKHIKTERELLVMLNHLARGKAEIRQQQADLLVEWARDQTLPVVAIGDYNLDYVFQTQKGNPAFKKILQDNIWQWVKPEEMIDTNWYDKMGDGEDDYPGSMLDFAFVANAAKTWKKTCRVIVREGDFPDDETTSDHRPFELEFH